MKTKDALIAWTPDQEWHGDDPSRGRVEVGPLLTDGVRDWTLHPFRYDMTGGAAHVDRRTMPAWQAIAMLFIDFHTMVVRDGIHPQVAHEAFLKIDEYRERIAPDIAGAAS